MSLFTAKENFDERVLDKPYQCNGCGRSISEGERALVKEYPNKHNRKQVCRTVLHNLEECWQAWDYRYWSAMGWKNQRQDKTIPKGMWYRGAMIN